MRIRPLHPDFGAEVLDFDCLAPTSADDIAVLRDAYDTHQLLLFRPGCAIPPERQVEISGWFGPPISNGGEGRMWSVLRNEEQAGSMRLPFHSDFSYSECPIKGISLHALDVPDGGTVTAFASSRGGWDRLAPAQQDRLRDFTLRHYYRTELGLDWPEFITDHPLCLPHPRTGLPILYLTELHAHRIVELPEPESDALIADLIAHLYAPAHVYTHHWQRHDLLIWDNLAVQHSRPERSSPEQGKRALQRVALSEMGLPELIARIRARAKDGDRLPEEA